MDVGARFFFAVSSASAASSHRAARHAAALPRRNVRRVIALRDDPKSATLVHCTAPAKPDHDVILTPMNPTLRPPHDDDAQPLARLITQLGYPTEPAQMHDRLQELQRRTDMAAIVAEMGGAVVGMIGLMLTRGFEFDGCQGEIIALVVDEAHRGAGIGRALVLAGEAWLRQRGAHRIKINTSHRRTDAHRFYERMGYAATGLRFVKLLG